MDPPVFARRALHLGVLYALAVSGPLFHELAGQPQLFTSRQAGGGAFVAFALVAGLVPPLAMIGLEALVALRSEDVAARMQLAFVGLLAGLGAAQIFAGLPTVVALALAAAAAVAFGWLYANADALRTVATWLWPLPLVVVGLFLFVGSAAGNVRGDQATPVVMVVFDEFTGTSLLDRHNRIDARLYPNFARLTRDGTYYRNFTAAADETTRVTAGLMTGDKWHEHALPIASEYPTNLFTLLGATYRMRAEEEASDFCPPAICRRAPRTGSTLLRAAGLVYLHRVAPGGIDRHLTSRTEILSGSYDPVAASRQVTDESREHKRDTVLRELGAGGRPARYHRWLRSIDGKVGRTLYFKHVLLPHVPWQYLPDGRLYRHEDEWIKGMSDPPAFGDRWFLIQDYQRHLVQLAYTDRLLGELIERLKNKGIYDKALIVITADNGESFLHENHDRHIADAVTFTDIASTPLLIKRPFQKRGGYDDRHVRTFDVVPSMADLLGVAIDKQSLGQSIFEPRTRVPDRVSVHREQFKEGDTFSISLAGYQRDRRLALRRKVGIFGDGLWRIGPHHDLVGRRARAARIAPRLSASLNPAMRRLLRAVKPRSGFVPANITGTLSGGGARRGIPLALALDGRVAAVGWSAKLKGDPRIWFSFLAEPSFLRAGANRAALYRIAAGGSLERIALG